MRSNICGRVSKLETLAHVIPSRPLAHLSDDALGKELLTLLKRGGYQGDTLPPQVALDALRVELGRAINADQPTRARKRPGGPLPPCAGVVVDSDLDGDVDGQGWPEGGLQ